MFGFTSPEMTLFNPETTNDRGVVALAIGGPLVLLCHILSALFEGTIFTYAILKHEVMAPMNVYARGSLQPLSQVLAVSPCSSPLKRWNRRFRAVD